MLLFHGSESIIKKPEYGKGRPNNDYGKGFYCTQDKVLACEWAVDLKRDGYVNCYELPIDELTVLNLNSDKYCILHWITMLLKNRRFELNSPLAVEAFRYLTMNFSVDLSGIDLIRGYRADDSYFSFAEDFVNGVISVSQLQKAMKLGNLGEQIMLRSENAFHALTYTGCEGVSATEWYEQKLLRDRKARVAYKNMSKDSYIKGDLYIIRLIDEEVKPNDPRLR
ncbi:MAG: DUF3990 domain-containing protein [Lachnospiraceae bacterium]|nr:DUF3990 domain-containing protein [Lachnospiraceae bacterium]